jgi:hypothetical protein
VSIARRADIPPLVAASVLICALTFYWYREAIGSTSDELSALEAWVIPIHVGVVLAVELAALATGSVLARRVLGRHWPVIALAAAIFTANFFAAFLVHFGPYLVQTDVVRWGVLPVVFALAALLVSELHQSRALRLAAVIVAPLLLAGALAADAWGSGTAEPHAPGEATLSPGLATDATTVRKVAFAHRRNVYLIALDALTPDEFARSYMGLPTPLAYTTALERNGARVIPHAFADREASRPSLNSLLALDVNYWDALPDSVKYGFFTGRRRSPLGEIFRNNGYRIQTMYEDSYFGRAQGPYVDFYGVSKIAGVCDRVESRFGFLGYCTRQVLAVLRRLIPALDRTESSAPALDFVLQRIRIAADDRRPWFTLAYLTPPGHVKQSYNHAQASDREEFRAYFTTAQHEAAEAIDAVLATIRERDAGAIVLLFGDHGTMMTLNQHYDDDPTFFVLDRHAIEMAIWPADACARELDAASSAGFITIALATRAIITCLADGVDPIAGNVTYALPYWTRDRFERYLRIDAGVATGSRTR